MAARSRLWIEQEISGNPVSIQKEMPFNAELLQWSFTSDLSPTEDELFVIYKTSPVFPLIPVYFVRSDLSIVGSNKLVCNEIWNLKRGEFLRVTYDNTQNLNIGIQIILREAQ